MNSSLTENHRYVSYRKKVWKSKIHWHFNSSKSNIYRVNIFWLELRDAYINKKEVNK